MITNVGKKYLIDVGLRNQTKITTWYIGLIDQNSFSLVSPSDTASEHGGWIESQAYTEGTRQSITIDEPSDATGVGTNGTAVSFSINADTHIAGVFLISNNTKGGTTGTLLSTFPFKGPVKQASGTTFNATIKL